MSKKGQLTTSDYLDFDYVTGKVFDLRKDPKNKLIADYIQISINTGLRSSDVLNLTWQQLRRDPITITEKKTGKVKTLGINETILDLAKNEKDGSPFITRQNTVVSIQWINKKLKEVFASDIKKLNVSSHSLRKCFGRRVYNKNGKSEASLILLCDLFNHASLKDTKKYLGIRQEELNSVYYNL